MHLIMKKYAALLVILLTFSAAVGLRAQGVSNMSVLVTLPPGGTQIVGFIIPGTPTSITGTIVTTVGGTPVSTPVGTGTAITATPTALLLRAVGPTLKSFGISNPVAAPHMRLFHPANAFGSALFIDYPGTAPTYGVNFPAVFTAAGAFPLTGGELAMTAYSYGTFYPGVYYVNITDDTEAGGTALFELYVLSGPIAASAPLVLTPQ